MVVPRGGAVMTADGERWGLGHRRWGGGTILRYKEESVQGYLGGGGAGGE